MVSVLDNIQYMYNKSLIKVLREDFVEDYINIFEEQYDTLFVNREFRSYDRTAPKYIKQDIINYIRSELNKAIDKLDPKGDMDIVGINLDAIEPPSSKKDTDSLRLFYFYLYGIPGEYVSISLEDWKKIFREPKGKLGRFGTMIMMEMDAYLKLYVASKGNMRGFPSPSAIYHPFSGSPPSRIFDIVQEKVVSQFGKYFRKAGKLVSN
jgi:hypothetical protein